jgi:Beta protein
MFGPKHYIPLMRAKDAELRALRDLAPTLRPWVTPMLECPPSVLRRCDSAKELQARLDGIASHLSGWSGRTVFLDFSMLQSTTERHPLEVVAASATQFGVRPVPVVSLKIAAESAYDISTYAVLARNGSAMCLRLSPAELNLGTIEVMLNQRLRRYGVRPEQVDLVIDRGGIDGSSVTYSEFAHLIPSIDSWRTLTVLAGSFPKDLAELARGEIHRLRRFEWLQWRNLDSWVGRRPAFGDYTIQHVNFKEPVPVPNVSASVRYTIENEFFVMRGEGVLNEGGPGYGQWNAWAALLTGRPEFFGATFSAGDRYIVDRASDWNSPGTAQTWLQAGFSHHVTTAALQVADRLEQVRQVSATAADWVAVVDVERPDATW